MSIINVNGRSVEYTVKTSNRATRISITIKNGEVSVTMPVGANTQQALSFLESKKSWLARHLIKEAQTFGSIAKPETGQNQLLYLGSWHQADLVLHKGGSIRVQLLADQILIQVPETMEAGGITGEASARLEEALVRWYREQAAMVCGEKLHHFSKIMGLTPASYTIKEQRTRWGSCSTRKNINLNWRILLAPESVIDYLIVHELAHLRQMNHSTDFWQEVGKFLPDYAKEKNWLRINGGSLLKYNPASGLILALSI